MEELVKIIKELSARVEALERQATLKNITLPSDGKLVIPLMTSDPASPVNGQVWINTTSNQIKFRKAGATVVVTVT